MAALVWKESKRGCSVHQHPRLKALLPDDVWTKGNSWDVPTLQLRTTRELCACDWDIVDPVQQNELPPENVSWGRYAKRRFIKRIVALFGTKRTSRSASVIISRPFLTEGLSSAVRSSWQNQNVCMFICSDAATVRSASRILSTCWTPRHTCAQASTHAHFSPWEENSIHVSIFNLLHELFCVAMFILPAWFEFNPAIGQKKLQSLSAVMFQPVPPFGDHWDATPERTHSPASGPSMLYLLVGFLVWKRWKTRSYKKEEGAGEESRSDGRGGGERMDGLDGGRNGRVFEGGLCESLIPRVPSTCPNMEAFAIARGLFSRPTADQWENQRIAEGGGRKEETAVGESFIGGREWKYEDEIEIK